MRNVLVRLFALQLACSAFCFGQTKIHLQDISAKGSPIQVSGSVLFEDDASKRIRFSYLIEGSLANVSNRSVVLMIIRFASGGLKGPGLDYSYEKDYFFSLGVFEVGKVEDFRSSPIRFGSPTVNGQPIAQDDDISSAPIVTAQVVFVQFVDGTTWGDLGRGRESLLVRNQTQRELVRLERVLQNGGEQALTDELSKQDSTLLCINSLVSECRGKGDSCMADGLHSMIDAARRHEHDIEVKSSALLVDRQ
jgi:hypothetical protein